MQDAAFLLPPHSSLLEPIGGCPPDDYMIPRSYLAGLILSNDGTSPNTVLDISAGQCVDSTNAFVINLAAFTKSTGGSWAAGSGSNGMGTGLTIANSTWYHVFAIIKGGNPDVYFDTSVTAANAPAGTTAFRRIGSFLTNGSAQIIAFTQNGDEFAWVTTVEDVNTATWSTGPTLQTLTVPTGVRVNALFGVFALYVSAGRALIVYPPDAGSGSGATIVNVQPASTASAGLANIRTNGSAQIGLVGGANGGATYSINTYGWIDTRGRDA
jgi:hypothetical protein